MKSACISAGIFHSLIILAKKTGNWPDLHTPQNYQPANPRRALWHIWHGTCIDTIYPGKEKTMQDETFFDSMKRNLNGEPGQPIVLGVCKTLAARFNQEVWLIRLAAIVLGVIYTFGTLVAYILLGLFMDETSHRTKSLFEGLGIWFRELTEKLGNLWSNAFGGNNHSNRHRNY
jgi:phage shock protein PspC (stress-responsive transcriptional regulator)